MNTWVLGISCFYHDSAATLTRDGEIIAALQEERVTRRKNDPRFPSGAINYCLEQGQIGPDDLSAVVYMDNPLMTLDRVVRTVLNTGESAKPIWDQAARSTLGLKMGVEKYIRRDLPGDYPILYSQHHLSHAASAFYPSPFDSAAVLTVDGVGEWATTTIGRASGNDIEITKEIRFPHSLGLLYSAVTYYCGFKVNSGEYKLMGLASYGEPNYAGVIRDNLIDIKADGSYRLDMDYFGYMSTGSMINERFESLFGGPARAPESLITRKEMDLAASIQHVLEEAICRLAAHACELAGDRRLVMAGGVALNCVANGRLLRDGIVDELWIQPAAGDAGGSLGAALYATHQYFGLPRKRPDGQKDSQKGSYLGPGYSSGEVEAFLDVNEYPFETVSAEERARVVASALADGKTVGYMVGRTEFGPRALGARSILGDATKVDTQVDLNLKVKYRESFRPFAPAVLEENAQEYFDLKGSSPYMLLVAPVQESRRLPADLTTSADDMLQIVRRARSDVPAITHVDYSARIQTVGRDEKPDFHAVIEEFRKITGHSVIVNTSFNVRGEPIVMTPEDAYRCFMRTELDLLVIEDCLLLKDGQPEFNEEDDWRDKFELD